MVNWVCDASASATPIAYGAVTRTSIGGRECIFMFRPTDFFSNWLIWIWFERNSSGRTSIYEYTSPPQIAFWLRPWSLRLFKIRQNRTVSAYNFFNYLEVQFFQSRIADMLCINEDQKNYTSWPYMHICCVMSFVFVCGRLHVTKYITKIWAYLA